MSRSIASLILISAAALAACGPAVRQNQADAGDDGVGPCGDSNEGAHQCDGTSFQVCTAGQWMTTQECNAVCDPNLGCVVCAPGTGTCTGMSSHACLPDGSGYYDEFCDPLMGSTCNQTTGVCDGACTFTAIGNSYIGCDYYATQSSQLVNPSFQFAVAVSNTTGNAAVVTIEGGVLPQPITLNVATGAVATQYLPWVPGLKRCMTEGSQECGPPESYGGLVVKGGYHLRSTQPVTVYQFSPLDYAFGGKFSFSNDASLLLPTTSWTGNYVLAGWQMWNPMDIGLPFPPMPSVLDVTAEQDGTAVTITTRAATHGGDGAPSFSPGSPQTVTLNAGDVLQLMSDTGDLTGSIVQATKPVSVLAGQHCTQVPTGYTACDHMEESMFPVETLSNEYLVTAPFLPALAGPRAEMVRVTAAEPAVTVTLDPAVGGPYTLNNVGDFVELPQIVADFKVHADHKVIVTSYMESQDAPGGGGTGDPAMTVEVPIEQYRLNYQFHAPTNYDSGNFVNITAPAGAVVQLDGAAVTPTSFTPIGTSGYGIARLPLSNAGTGTHTAESDMPFGISVYGYGLYTSYWYPGGLDLKPIVVD